MEGVHRTWRGAQGAWGLTWALSPWGLLQKAVVCLRGWSLPGGHWGLLAPKDLPSRQMGCVAFGREAGSTCWVGLGLGHIEAGALMESASQPASGQGRQDWRQGDGGGSALKT